MREIQTKGTAAILNMVLVSAFCLTVGLVSCASVEDQTELLPNPAPQILTSEQSISAAFEFLYRQMDLLHRELIIYDEPYYAAFFPSYIGDTKAIDVNAAYQGEFVSGKNSFRINYQPERQNKTGEFSIVFLYPDGNWGKHKGRNLQGATTLRFWAKSEKQVAVNFKIGGLNRGVNQHSNTPLKDSFGPVETGFIRLHPKWTQYEIPLRNNDLSSVIAGFIFTLEGGRNSANNPIYLDKITIDLDKTEQPRFVQSFYPTGYPTPGAPNIAHTYDQALVLLAFLARGTDEDLRRSKLIADAMLLAQKNDRDYHDGRLRNGYASGELLDELRHTTRFPGKYIKDKVCVNSEDQLNKKSGCYEEDSYALGNDTGNNAWAALALVQFYHIVKNRPNLLDRDPDTYLHAAIKIAKWIVDEHKAKEGGYFGGYEIEDGQWIQSRWRSAEHNIDLIALFRHLAYAQKAIDPMKSAAWNKEEKHAQDFVKSIRSMDNNNLVHLWTGKNECGETNKSPIPLDVQTWGILALDSSYYGPILDWALANCREQNKTYLFDFNCNDGDGTWWEGTAQMTLALKYVKRYQEAEQHMNELRMGQILSGDPLGAFPAASIPQLTTGFIKEWGTWIYTNEPHIGATAWFLFAALGKNPYYLVPYK